MRRPLFMICLCLVVIAAMRLLLYKSSDEGEGQMSLLPTSEEVIVVTGKVSQKDTKEFTLESVVLLSEAQSTVQSTVQSEQNLTFKSEEGFEVLSSAAASWQTIPQNRLSEVQMTSLSMESSLMKILSMRSILMKSLSMQSILMDNSSMKSLSIQSILTENSSMKSLSMQNTLMENSLIEKLKGISIEQNLICEYSTEQVTQTNGGFGTESNFQNGSNCDREKLCLGSIVVLQGTFQPFLAASNPGEFDAAKYYDSLGIGGKLTNVTILAQSREYSGLEEMLYQLRCYLKNRLYQVFPQKEASILTAMLVGDKEELDSGIKELYKENGIVHILSISGLHITMIGMGIYKILRRIRMPVWMAAICGGSVLFLYGVMTGMSLSACRAIGMYFIRMLAAVVGRSYDMLTALGVIGAIMVWQNPENLNNAGFLLSFGSVLGVGWLYPALLPKEKQILPKTYEARKWKQILNKLLQEMKKGLLQSILAGTSITLFTLPIQLWFYYEVPTYSILLNVLVLPFMGAVMTTGLVTMLLPGTGMMGTLTCLILKGYEWMCKCFHQLPFHTWNPGKPKLWQVIVYYLLLIAVVQLEGKAIKGKVLKGKVLKGNALKGNGKRINKVSIRQHISKAQTPLLLALAISILTLHIRIESTITFLDVGQGDGIVMELASGEVYLFDCGSSSRSRVGEYVLLPFLKYKGITHIDAIFVSHTDTDHCSGIEELLMLAPEEGITIGQLVLPQIVKNLREEELSSLLESAQKLKQKTPIIISYINAGDQFITRSASFLCLHPPSEYETEDSNTYSECFYVELSGKRYRQEQQKEEMVSLLLTGDVEGEGEELLLQELKNHNISNVTILKVAHHGSRNSTQEALLKVAKPIISIISCGKNNSYGHPHEETLERLKTVGSEVMITAEYGAISIQIGQDVKISGFTK